MTEEEKLRQSEIESLKNLEAARSAERERYGPQITVSNAPMLEAVDTLINKPVGYRLLKGYAMLHQGQDPWEED